MSSRPVFFPRFDTIGVEERFFEFEWASGFSTAQKRKCIASLHDAVRREKPDARVLEISSKSTEPAGVALSAFNLKLPVGGAPCTVESAFQAGKVFEGGVGPFPEMLPRESREVRAFVQKQSAGRALAAFELDGVRWPLEPTTAFYDWLYLNALAANPEPAAAVETYDAFTDIEFNPERSINCQARSAALWRSLRHAGKLEEALSSKEAFLSLCGTNVLTRGPATPVKTAVRTRVPASKHRYRVGGATFEFMHEPALRVIRRYAHRHPGITLARLQSVFADDPNGGYRELVHAADEEAVRRSPEKFSHPIRLDDGTFFVVTTEWDQPTLRAFCRFSQGLDPEYRIEEV